MIGDLCATDGCWLIVRRPPPVECCEECLYDQLGEEVEQHPIGAVYAAEIKKRKIEVK